MDRYVAIILNIYYINNNCIPTQAGTFGKASSLRTSLELKDLKQMHFNYPFRVNKNGHTDTANIDAHIHQLVEQVLFTAQGERVNRLDFGTGVNQLVFAPNSDELAAATQFLVQGSLQQWLGDLIKVELVDVKSIESSLHISIQYSVIKNKERIVQNLTKVI